MSGQTIQARTAVARALADLGIETFFGVLGGGNMYIAHELRRVGGTTYVPAAREDGAVLMAAGYARTARRLGLATVTYGGGMTNAVTSLAAAARSNSPILVLTGDYPVSKAWNEAESLQHVDLRSVVTAAGVEYRRIQSADSAAVEVRSAADDALSQSRPVVIAVPVDLQTVDTDYEPATTTLELHRRRIIPCQDEMDRATEVVEAARRPLILAGRGASLSQARDAIVALADAVGAPLATTVLAKGLFSGSRWDLGIYGALSRGVAAEVIAAADCLIVIGASLSELTTAGGKLLKGKRVVQCDSSEAALRTWHVDAPVLGDARLFAQRLTGMLGETSDSTSSFRSHDSVKRMADGRPEDEFTDHSSESGMDMRTAIIRTSHLLPDERTLVTDAGRFVYAPLRFFDVPDAEAFVPAFDFGSIGQGLPTAIGAAFARPDRTTVLVTGDGGLLTCLVDFRAAVEFNRDLIVIVMNDGRYGQEYHRFRLANMSTDMSRILSVDFAAVAGAMGGVGMRISELAQLDLLRDAVERRQGPLLVDMKIDSTIPLGFYD